MPSSNLPSLLVDARPILVRNVDSIWTNAEQVRDELYEDFLQVCTAENIDALVIKSDPFVHPAWVKFECWLPKDGRTLTERVSATITVESKPYHRYKFEFHVTLHDRGKNKTIRGLRTFEQQEVFAFVRYLLRRGPKPSYWNQQLRQWPFELWKARNKIIGVEPDWPGMAPIAVFIVSFSLLSLVPVIGLLGLIGGGVLQWFLAQRPTFVRSAGKPYGEPRSLQLVDWWQTVIFGTGNDYQEVRRRFFHRLETSPYTGCRSHVEKIWHWGLEGKEEREQIVVSFGRAIIFCQIYQYGNELYVGWDGHLNRGQWVEKTLTRGRDAVTDEVVLINSVESGVQPLTEYDLTDLSCLMEWTHAQLVQVVKQFMEERRIDQEIDFKIQRGERQGLTASAERPAGEGEKSGLGRIRQAFFRRAA